MSEFKFQRVEKGAVEVFYQLEDDTRLFLTKDKSRIVPDGSPDAAYLFCTQGSLISEADALKYNLIERICKVSVIGVPRRFSVEVSG